MPTAESIMKQQYIVGSSKERLLYIHYALSLLICLYRVKLTNPNTQVVWHNHYTSLYIYVAKPTDRTLLPIRSNQASL